MFYYREGRVASCTSKKQGLGAVDYPRVIDIEAEKDFLGGGIRTA